MKTGISLVLEVGQGEKSETFSAQPTFFSPLLTMQTVELCLKLVLHYSCQKLQAKHLHELMLVE